LLFRPTLTGRPSFFDQMLGGLRKRRVVPLFTDEWRTPLGLCVAAQALLDLVTSDFTGLLHLGGPERLSRYDMGRRLATHLGLDPAVLQATERATTATPEPRPRAVSLDCS